MSPPSKFSLASVRDLGPRFILLFTAGILSDIGGFSTHTALVLHIYRLTGKNRSFMGLTALAGLVPMLVASPLGGIWAEKYDRRRVMILNDLFRLPLVLLMAWTDQVWVILALQCLISASTSAFNPSRQSIIPELVKPGAIHLANSVNGGLLSLVHVLGPVLGSVIYANTESLKWIVMINAGTYALSAAILFNLRYKRTEPATSSHEGFVRSLAAGFSYVRGEKDLLCILLTLMTSGTAIGLLVPLLRPFIEEVLHGTDRTYGQIIGAFGAGGIVGPLAGYWAGRRLGLGKTLLVAFFVEALLLILWSRIGSIPLSCAVLFVWGVVIFTMIPCYMSYVHTYARPEYMGRVFALLDQSHFMPQILGASLIIILGNYLPSQLILTCAGIAYLLVVLMMRPTPGARLLRSRTGAHDSAANPPSATPDSERLNL